MKCDHNEPFLTTSISYQSPVSNYGNPIIGFWFSAYPFYCKQLILKDTLMPFSASKIPITQRKISRSNICCTRIYQMNRALKNIQGVCPGFFTSKARLKKPKIE